MEPLAGVSVDDVQREAQAKHIVGLKLQVVSDEALAQLKRWCDLKTLDLSNSNITDAGLANLKGLKGLKTLDLEDTAITDLGLANLKDLNELRTLVLVDPHH